MRELVLGQNDEIAFVCKIFSKIALFVKYEAEYHSFKT